MSELKEIELGEAYKVFDDDKEFYLKSEADEVIAEKDKTIAELNARIADGDKDFEIADHQNERLLKIVRHQKHKRCLAMAEEWRGYATFCGIQSSWHNNRGFGKTAEKYTWKECHAWKCVKRWLELAEKFKPNNSTAQ